MLCGAQPKQLQRNLVSCKFECILCKDKEKDDINHVIIKCTKTEKARNSFWENIYEYMPQAMKTDLKTLGQKRALGVILSGLGCTYVKEWENIYANIAVQIWKIYNNRATEIDNMIM